MGAEQDTSAELLAQAIQAVKAGNRAEARQLLQTLLKQEPGNEQAWLWLSAAVTNHEAQIKCLQQVLAINPANQSAQRGLAKLTATPEPPPAPAPITSQPTPLTPRPSIPTPPGATFDSHPAIPDLQPSPRRSLTEAVFT
jgi:hypothetical protein